MNYHALTARIQKRFGNGLQFFSSYTWSKWMGLCCDENGDGQPEIPIPQYYHRNYARMPDDRTNNFQLSAIYQLPFGKNQRYLTGASLRPSRADGRSMAFSHSLQGHP